MRGKAALEDDTPYLNESADTPRFMASIRVQSLEVPPSMKRAPIGNQQSKIGNLQWSPHPSVLRLFTATPRTEDDRSKMTGGPRVKLLN